MIIKSFFTMLMILLLQSIMNIGIAQTIIPPLNNGVMDNANVLKASEKSKLDKKIMQFEHESGSQIAVLIIPQLNNEDIVAYGIRVMEEWKLGRKDIDDGILLIISINDRKTRLEVGYGLEGAIPDITAAKILNEYLAPHFKNQNYYQGINQATDAIIALIQKEPLPSTSKSFFDNWLIILLINIICGSVLLVISLWKVGKAEHYHALKNKNLTKPEKKQHKKAIEQAKHKKSISLSLSIIIAFLLIIFNFSLGIIFALPITIILFIIFSAILKPITIMIEQTKSSQKNPSSNYSDFNDNNHGSSGDRNDGGGRSGGGGATGGW